MSRDDKGSEPRAPSLTSREVEEFRAYFSEKMSILQKGGKSPEGTEYRLANGVSDDEEEETEDEAEMEEKLGNTEGSQPHSVPGAGESQKSKEAAVQFSVSDEDEDGFDADFLKVTRHNVFGLNLEENQALQVRVLPVEGLPLLPTASSCVLHVASGELWESTN